MVHLNALRFINRNALLLLIITIIIVNVAYAYLSSHSAYIFGGDIGSPSTSTNQITYPFFIWSYLNYSGYVNNFNLSSPVLIIYQLFVYLISGLRFGTLLNLTLNTIILRVIAGVGMFLLVYNLLNNNKAFSRRAALSGIFASALFTLHYALFSSFGTGIFNVALLPFSALFLLLFTRSAYSGRFNPKYFVISILSTALGIDFLGYSAIIQGFLVLLLIFVFVVVFTFRKAKINIAIWLFGILLLSVAINASWIGMTHTAANLSSSELQMFSTSAYSDFLNFYAPIVAGYDIQLLPYTSALTIQNTLFDVIITVLVLLSGFFAYGRIAALVRRVDLGAVFTLAMFVTLLILLAANASIHKPFGGVFSTLYHYIPYLIVFKYVENTRYVMLFLTSTLSGFTLGSLLMHNHIKKHMMVTTLIVVLMALLLAYYLYVGSALQLFISGIPYGTGTQYATLLPFVHSIPIYALNISSYINSQIGQFSVATLPVDDDWHLATWYDAPDVYAGLLNSPVYTGGFAYSEFFFPPTQDEYRYIGYMVQNGNTKNMNIAHAFGAFGIKYIIVQGDTSNHTLSPNNPLLSYSFNAIYSNMNASTGMLLVGRYNTSSIYQNLDVVPLVYATNIRVVASSSSTKIINLIMNKSFNTNAYSVYSSSFSAPILWYGSAQIFTSNNTSILPISKFSKPNVSFVYNTPTKVSVHISNATTPFYLIFRETYNSHWNAYYSNGTAIPQKDHIAVNGFANAWYMNSTGSYYITLYYNPQTKAWLFWIVSFVALFTTCVIGWLGWRTMKY